MEFVPEISLHLFGGWLLTLIYIVVNLGIAFSKKGTYQRLVNPVRKYVSVRDKILYLSYQISWKGTILLPALFPIKFGTIFFYLGFFLFSLGMILTAISLWNYVTTPLDQPVRKGLYQISRNPIYAAYNLIGFGIGFLVGSWLIIILHIIEMITCHFIVLDEEKYCLERYGNEYQKYLKKIPRYYFRSP